MGQRATMTYMPRYALSILIKIISPKFYFFKNKRLKLIKKNFYIFESKCKVKIICGSFFFFFCCCYGRRTVLSNFSVNYNWKSFLLNLLLKALFHPSYLTVSHLVHNNIFGNYFLESLYLLLPFIYVIRKRLNGGKYDKIKLFMVF